MKALETGNYVLIVLGAVLIASGPVIIYKTITGVLKRRKEDPTASIHPISNGLNFLIAILFFLAGILFIVNNLRGNPLA